MIKWKKIERKYPKAFHRLCQNFNDGIGYTGINKHNNLVFFEDDVNESWITNTEIFEFLDSNNLYIYIRPEFYSDGINWNWQIFWYLPKEQQYGSKITGGTGLYGDNGQYPRRKDAEEKAIKRALKILEARSNGNTN